MDYHNNTYEDVVSAEPKKQVNGLAVGGLVCGIISILLCCCCGVGVVVGIAGIILSLLSKKGSEGKLSGVAIAGLICSCVGLLFSVLGCVLMIASSSEVTQEMKVIMDQWDYFY